MCMSLEKLKSQSVYLVWLAAMIVFSFFFWFSITPLLFPYTTQKGDTPSRTYIPEFGMIGFAFWITFLAAFWCCFRKLTREEGNRCETSRLLPIPDDPELKRELNDSVKRRLGLLTPRHSPKKSEDSIVEEKVREETEGEEARLKLDETTLNVGDKPKRPGLISRLSSIRRKKMESDEPEMKIISLPDFSTSTQNSFKLLMPHYRDESDLCFLCSRNSVQFHMPANVCTKCGKPHYPDSTNKIRLSWNTRKRKDLNIELGEEMQVDGHLPSHDTQEITCREEDYVEDSDLNSMGIHKESIPECNGDSSRKSVKKRESSFLLQALHEQSSRSEIFFVVNDFGHLVNEPVELAKIHCLK